MQPKLCTRCQFMVRPKSKLCAICGNREFAVVEIEPAPSPDLEPNASNAIRSVMHDFADDVALTAEKSVRAWHQIRKLISG
jgi:hypothetical protein